MTEKLLRTFLSVPVPREVSSKKNMLYSTLETVDGDINWVKNAQLHLTLKFLGHTPESSINDVIDHVDEIMPNIKPFDLKIDETGCFPVPTRPRTLWLGVKGDLDPLLTMVESIESSLESLGFPRSDRDFSPQNLHANSEDEQERDLGDLILGIETHLHLAYGGQVKNLKLRISSIVFFT